MVGRSRAGNWSLAWMVAPLLIVAGSYVLAASPLGGQDVSLATLTTAATGNVKLNTLELRGRIVAGVDAKTGQPLPNTDAATLLIRARLSDAYLRVVEDRYIIRKDGFSGRAPLFDVSYKNGASGSAGFDTATYIPLQRAAAARLWLGIAGVLNGPLALKAQRQGSTASHQIAGPDGFECIVDVDAETRLPVRVRHVASAFFYTPPAAGESMAARRSEKAEIVMTFSDRRRVGDVLLPHAIVTTARSLVTGESLKTEEIMLSSALVNPSIDAAFVK